ncbi:S66 peptidase family protein [Actinomadura macrotermitis]|uniref:Putative murein peptide carboxypeptidase n=1 Tax=Actinomadura macrotermitis TaxID=2585200 RepID=A0A7K0C674_9ACTN|nr:LD-carboxypeptidase [Actinomadura macrotermitis]MQY08582.1 putative murein peptide carboxypeptidase [Actinomadura macrotermitis]
MSGGARTGAGDGRSAVPSATPHRPRLRPGDRVAVVAPSGPVDPARLDAGRAVLRGLGLEVIVGKHALQRTGLAEEPAPASWHGLAGADADRAADLTDAWCDPAVRGVVCARGGYGATRVLDHLDWAALAAAGPKALLGSSDVTALHAAFGARLGVTTFFGPMPAGFLGTGHAASVESLRAALFGAPDGRPAAVRGTHALVPGRAEGPLTGGTLALLTALLGTPYAPPPAAGRIVFLEDVTEAPYRIDRMLVQLRQSGWLDGAAGFALGAFTDCGDPAELDAVLAARLGPLGVPVLAGLPAGHGTCQSTLELGARVRLDAGALTLQAPHGGAR